MSVSPIMVVVLIIVPIQQGVIIVSVLLDMSFNLTTMTVIKVSMYISLNWCSYKIARDDSIYKLLLFCLLVSLCYLYVFISCCIYIVAISNF